MQNKHIILTLLSLVIVASFMLTACTQQPEHETTNTDTISDTAQDITVTEDPTAEETDEEGTDASDTNVSSDDSTVEESEPGTETEPIESEEESFESVEDTKKTFSIETTVKEETSESETETEESSDTIPAQTSVQLEKALKYLNVKTISNTSLLCYRIEKEADGGRSVVTIVNNANGQSATKNSYMFYENSDDYNVAVANAGTTNEGGSEQYHLLMISSELSDAVANPEEDFFVMIGGYTLYYG